MRNNNLTKEELSYIYNVLLAFKENQIINPSESWEQDHFDEKLIDKTNLNSIIKKLEGSLGKDKFSNIKKKVLTRKYHSFNNEVNENVYSKIEKAFKENKRLEIGYFNMENAETIKRKIDIYYKNRKYVVAYDHSRKDMRKFRVSRIVNARILDEKYSIPSSFNKNDYL